MNAAISAKNVTRTPLKPKQTYWGIRIQGTKEDLEWFIRMLEEKDNIKIVSHSELFQNKGTSRFFREYVDVVRKKMIVPERGGRIMSRIIAVGNNKLFMKEFYSIRDSGKRKIKGRHIIISWKKWWQHQRHHRKR